MPCAVVLLVTDRDVPGFTPKVISTPHLQSFVNTILIPSLDCIVAFLLKLARSSGALAIFIKPLKPQSNRFSLSHILSLSFSLQDFKIVSVAAIARTEADNTHLVAITQHGHRLFFSLEQPGTKFEIRFLGFWF